MSDSLATFSAAVSDVSAIGSLAFGALGGVVLGSFAFGGMEVPEFITFGGKQQMDVKRLIGGERIIDILGPDERALAWSGIFIGGFPRLRAQQLDQMRIAGQVLPLIWGTFYYTVLIEDFAADTRYGQVPYRISCIVQRNEAAQPLDAANDLLGSLTDDVSSALGYAGTASSALTTVQNGLQTVSNLVPGSSALAGILRDVGAAQTVLGGIQTAAGAGINGVSAVAAAGNLVGGSAGITSAASNAGLLAQASAALGFTNRMSINAGGTGEP
jgi:hypothetical protein